MYVDRLAEIGIFAGADGQIEVISHEPFQAPPTVKDWNSRRFPMLVGEYAILAAGTGIGILFGGASGAIIGNEISRGWPDLFRLTFTAAMTAYGALGGSFYGGFPAAFAVYCLDERELRLSMQSIRMRFSG